MPAAKPPSRMSNPSSLASAASQDEHHEDRIRRLARGLQRLSSSCQPLPDGANRDERDDRRQGDEREQDEATRGAGLCGREDERDEQDRRKLADRAVSEQVGAELRPHLTGVAQTWITFR